MRIKHHDNKIQQQNVYHFYTNRSASAL